MAAVVAFAQTSTTQTQQSSQSGTGQASSSSSATASAGGGQGGRGIGTGSGGGSARSTPKPTHAIIYSPGEEPVENPERILQAQSVYLNRLAAAGKLIFAGPWRDERGGLTLLHVRTDEEARKLMDGDPAVQNGLFKAELKAWNVTIQGAGTVAVTGRG